MQFCNLPCNLFDVPNPKNFDSTVDNRVLYLNSDIYIDLFLHHKYMPNLDNRHIFYIPVRKIRNILPNICRNFDRQHRAYNYTDLCICYSYYFHFQLNHIDIFYIHFRILGSNVLEYIDHIVDP